MIYRNKATDTYQNVPAGMEDIIDKTLYEKIDLIDSDDNLSEGYLLSVCPKDEFTDDEIDKLIMFNLNVNIPYLHIKSGNKYYLINICIECTNGQEDRLKAVYRNSYGCIFTRDLLEFFKKFKRCSQ